MPGFILEKFGNCRKCEAEVEIWTTPKGKTMLVDPKPGVVLRERTECPRDDIQGLLDRFHFREGGCSNPGPKPNGTKEPAAERHHFVRGKQEMKPGTGHLCRGCRNHLVEADHGVVCSMTSRGGTVALETWVRATLKAQEPVQFARDFTQACTAFAPLSRPA